MTVLANACACRDQRGRLTLSRWASFDITGIKRSEQSLQQQEEMFRRIYEKAAFGMIILDLADQISASTRNSRGCRDTQI